MKKEINCNAPASYFLMELFIKINNNEIWEGLEKLIGDLLWINDVRSIKNGLLLNATKPDNIGKKELYIKCINACDKRIEQLLIGN